MSITKKRANRQKRLFFFLLGSLFAFPAQSEARSQEATIRLFVVGQPTSHRALLQILWRGPVASKSIKQRTYLQLRRLRNAIFAVKQARFRSPDLRKFYKQQRWYRPYRSASKVRMSLWARRNLKLILSYENKAKKKLLQRMRRRMLGPKPQVGIQGALQCYDYPTYRVVVDAASIRIAHKGSRGLCALNPRKILYSKMFDDGGVMQFDGIVGNAVVLTQGMGSDYFNLIVISLHNKKVLLKENALPPNGNLRYNSAQKVLEFNKSPKLPKSCHTKVFTRLAQTLKSCWPAVQKRYPILKDTPFPKGCNCRGLVPYLTVRHRWNPRKPQKPLQLTKKASCGCSS